MSCTFVDRQTKTDRQTDDDTISRTTLHYTFRPLIY